MRKHRNKRAGSDSAAKAGHERIFGVHAVSAALQNRLRNIHRLYATRNGLERISSALQGHSIEVRDVRPDELSRMLGKDTVHQGVMVETDPLPDRELSSVLDKARNGSPLVVLDQVTDPHNVGAILRSSAAFDAAALIMTRRNSPPLDGVLAKAASGAVEHVPVILVANLARTLDDLEQDGVQRIGLDGESDLALETTDISHPCALVLGAEGKGLRRLTAEKCDFLCRLTTKGPLASLNVSNAAAVALHAVTTR